MADAFDREVLRGFHKRLLAGDRSTNDFATLILPFLAAEIGRKFPRLDEQLVQDGVIDAFLDFCSHPDQFVEGDEGRSLESFLLGAAWRNVANLYESTRRRTARERRAAGRKKEIDVALDPAERSIRQEDEKRNSADLAEILEPLAPKDREFLTLQLNGVRKTEAFAKLLGIENLPIEQQRKEVKRHKDRIRGILKRKGLLP
jgi:RNA polymerase sigma-70 factor (ECF subfamily)